MNTIHTTVTTVPFIRSGAARRDRSSAAAVVLSVLASVSLGTVLIANVAASLVPPTVF